MYARGSLVLMQGYWYLMQVVLNIRRPKQCHPGYSMQEVLSILCKVPTHPMQVVLSLEWFYARYLPTDWDQKEEELGTQELILCKGFCHQS